MSKSKFEISRRHFLRGLGTALAVPVFESLLPTKALAQESGKAVRFGYVYTPNGVNQSAWYANPTSTLSGEAQLPFSLKPLGAYASDLLVARKINNPHGEYRFTEPTYDGSTVTVTEGAGDHARAGGGYLSERRVYKSKDENYRIFGPVAERKLLMSGNSIDVEINRLTGARTINLALETNGGSDSYRAGYQDTLSYRYKMGTAGTGYTPSRNAPIVDPKAAFTAIFNGYSTDDQTARDAIIARQKKSILDFVLGDAAQLRQKLCVADRCKLDEYLDAVRELESGLDTDGPQLVCQTTPSAPNYDPGTNHALRIKYFFDVLVLAFQCNAIDGFTMMMASEGSGRGYASHIPTSSMEPYNGQPRAMSNTGHHTLSHYSDNSDPNWALHQIKHIDRWNAQQFAYLVGQLKAKDDYPGTKLLDNSLISFGSAIANGNSHNNVDIPLLIAGRGGGAVRTGRVVDFGGRQLCDYHLGVARSVGANLTKFGFNTNPIDFS